MHHKLWNKQIPTILGMFIIIVGLSVTTFLTNRQTFFQSGATSNNQPQEVRITNITDSSFTISYKTNYKTSGYINYGSNNSLGQTAFDEKDITQKLQEHIIHSFTLKNLSPLTKYYFSIISGGDTYLNNNQDFEITTSTTISNLPNTDTISGKIILPDSTKPSEAIVYVITNNSSQILSSLMSNSGTYTINLNHLLTSDLSRLANPSENSVVQILILGDSLTSNALLYYSQIKNIPVITLSNNYDFRTNSQKKLSPAAGTTESFPTLNSTQSSKIKNVEILTPGKNQTFSNQKPVISGRGIPNQNVQITIHSTQQIQANVKADANGNWSYQPNAPLTAGNHTISVTAKDSQGLLKTITQSFAVYVATDSSSPAAIIYTPTPTPTITTPSITLSPTISQQPLPTTGNTSIIMAGIVGLLITVVGGLIFLLSRKGI